MYLFGQANAGERTLELRPYVGAGPQLPERIIAAQHDRDIDHDTRERCGMQTFGGAEAVVPRLPELTISNELAYYHPAGGFLGANAVGKLNYQVSVHFYLR